MKKKDYSEFSNVELKKTSSELRKKLFDLKMKNYLGQLANPIEIRDARKEIAKVETAISSVRA